MEYQIYIYIIRLKLSAFTCLKDSEVASRLACQCVRIIAMIILCGTYRRTDTGVNRVYFDRGCSLNKPTRIAHGLCSLMRRCVVESKDVFIRKFIKVGGTYS